MHLQMNWIAELLAAFWSLAIWATVLVCQILDEAFMHLHAYAIVYYYTDFCSITVQYMAWFTSVDW